MTVNIARRQIVALLLCALALVGCEPVEQQSNASDILRQDLTGTFEPVVPGKPLSFPQDHLAHPGFRAEWWYLTANLESDTGETFGVQWTLFRFATSTEKGDGWKSPQMYMAHTVVTSKNKTWHAERFARGGIGQAGVVSKPYRAWLDNWSWRSYGDTPFPGQLEFADGAMAGDLTVSNQGALIYQGDNGYSKKHATEDIASYYFSAPFLDISGSLQLDGKSYQVKGNGWYDREWSSVGLSEKQLGWDWFSIHLDDGSALMVYQIREKDAKPYYFGSLSWPDGKTIILQPGDIRLTPMSFTTHKGKNYPLDWRVDVPAHQIELKVDVVRKEQWLPFVFSYWEGPIKVSGSHSGQGFMELTGY
ncbi:carotenoid 1,2-hydratase [Photobacterium sp. SDRW27]|uniref:lipocalin-like domain-containing protein n=1 Tax=Photobacterium obscurum TaxID=2829490 RepID=UPI002244E20D|nr:lipocalin-like domain-containing protein [Photobacterium obscurum]MCW8327816.1 carotenoid 1,2-hydratase [Photobacterium obscurum]